MSMFPDAARPEAGPFRSVYRRVRSNDFFRHGLLVLASTLVLNSAAFIFHAIVSRRLGVAAYGSLYAVISLGLLASFPAGIFNTVVAKVAAEFREQRDPAHLRALAIFLCKTFGLGIVAYAVVGAALGGFIGGFLRVPSWTVMLASALAGVVVFVTVLRAVAQGTQDFRGLSASFVIDGGFKATLGVVLATSTFGLVGGLLGFFAGTALSGVFTFGRLWNRLGKASRAALRIDWRRLVATITGAAALTTAVAILSYGDVLVVKHFFGPHDAGIYSAASLGGKILFFLVGFVPMVLIPKTVASRGRGDSPLHALRSALLMVLVLSAGGLIGFAVFARLVIQLLVGSDFLAAAAFLPWYALAMALLATTNVVASYSIALHRFAFSGPIVFIALAEITAISAYHPSLQAVVTILVAGNAVAVAVTSTMLLFERPRAV
jgi:O-antigen/teichoic acid export membrane protein